MNQQRKMPAWQIDAIEVIQQFRDGSRQTFYHTSYFDTKEWKTKVRSRVEKRDDWSKMFLANMETILLALDVELLGEESAELLQEFLRALASVCHGSTNVRTRKDEDLVRAFANHIATPALNRVECPEECVKVFGEALQKYYVNKPIGMDLAVNATSLTYRDFMETVLKPVEKEFKSIRV